MNHHRVLCVYWSKFLKEEALMKESFSQLKPRSIQTTYLNRTDEVTTVGVCWFDMFIILN